MNIVKDQNFISVDGKSARDSYGNFYTIGELVRHEDPEAEPAIILNFEPKQEENEIIVNTDKGWAHLDFLVKILPEEYAKD